MNGKSYTVLGDLEPQAIRARAMLGDQQARYNLTQLGFQPVVQSSSFPPTAMEGWEQAQLGTLDVYEKHYQSRQAAEDDAVRLEDLGFTHIGGMSLV